jgi:ribonuclease R
LNKTRENHYKALLGNVSNSTSDQERKAEKLEYKVRDFYICDYYSKKIGESFEGVITTMLPYGFFVQMPDTSEGFVELIPKHGKPTGYEYDEQFMRFSNP